MNEWEPWRTMHPLDAVFERLYAYQYGDIIDTIAQKVIRGRLRKEYSKRASIMHTFTYNFLKLIS